MYSYVRELLVQDRPQPLAFMACISVSSSTLSCNLLTTVMRLVMLVAIFSTVSKVIVLLHFNFRYAILGDFLLRSMV